MSYFKKNKEILDNLPDEIRQKFMQNMRNLKPNRFNNILDEESLSLYTLIVGSFNWGATPEGTSYWQRVCRMSDKPKPKYKI